jgi:N-acetylglucosaminyldiphosphoundecaprenol N-acetyl-beta-D-mannosaminyltransferase
MGARIDRVTKPQFLAWLSAAAAGESLRLVANVNAHAMNLAWERPPFRAALNRADLVFVDGFGILLAARWLGLDIGERLTLADWMPDFLHQCAEKRRSVFWLGDTDEVGAAFEEWVRRHFPGVRWAGRHHGFFDRHGPQSDAVCAQITASGAEVLLVGMSMPIQEEWLDRYRGSLPGVHLAIACGGYARIATGIIPRGPRWMTDHGLEWLYRFFQQPRYTWKRYWLGNPLFLARALAWRHCGAKPR